MQKRFRFALIKMILKYKLENLYDDKNDLMALLMG